MNESVTSTSALIQYVVSMLYYAMYACVMSVRLIGQTCLAGVKGWQSHITSRQ